MGPAPERPNPALSAAATCRAPALCRSSRGLGAVGDPALRPRPAGANRPPPAANDRSPEGSVRHDQTGAGGGRPTPREPARQTAAPDWPHTATARMAGVPPGPAAPSPGAPKRGGGRTGQVVARSYGFRLPLNCWRTAARPSAERPRVSTDEQRPSCQALPSATPGAGRLLQPPEVQAYVACPQGARARLGARLLSPRLHQNEGRGHRDAY